MVNRVDINGETVLNLTADTVSADKLAIGVTAHNAAGAAIVGTMPGFFIGTAEPDASLGSDGDFYLQKAEG